jgi:NADPH:quinone reductase-like Zn-dependent oxidoreductase
VIDKTQQRSNVINELTLAANDANPENGAFARYITVKEDIQMHIPNNVSFEAAATTGVGVGTTCYALYKVLGLSLPDSTAGDHSGQTEARDTVLVYGGSTATGSIAIQLAKL